MGGQGWKLDERIDVRLQPVPVAQVCTTAPGLPSLSQVRTVVFESPQAAFQ